VPRPAPLLDRDARRQRAAQQRRPHDHGVETNGRSWMGVRRAIAPRRCVSSRPHIATHSASRSAPLQRALRLRRRAPGEHVVEVARSPPRLAERSAAGAAPPPPRAAAAPSSRRRCVDVRTQADEPPSSIWPTVTRCRRRRRSGGTSASAPAVDPRARASRRLARALVGRKRAERPADERRAGSSARARTSSPRRPVDGRRSFAIVAAA
jgi:hypothetical protein